MEGARLILGCAALLAACEGSPAPAPGLSPVSSASAAVSASAASESPSSPPIDETVAKPLSPRGAGALATDIQTRRERADWYVVDLNPTPRKILVEDTFLLVAGDRSAPLDEAAAQVKRTVEALWRGPLLHRPEEGVTLYVFAKRADYEWFRRQYEADETTKSDLSFYKPNKRWIVFSPEGSGWGTLNHEIAHPLTLADVPHAPFWALEGIPSVLEMAEFDPDGGALVNAGAHFRLQTLRDALLSKTRAPLVRLDRLFPLTTREAFDDANYDLHYAEAREALRWLLRRGLLWDWWHRLRDDIVTDPTGQKSFEAVVGPLDKAQDEWIAWIQSPESE